MMIGDRYLLKQHPRSDTFSLELHGCKDSVPEEASPGRKPQPMGWSPAEGVRGSRLTLIAPGGHPEQVPPCLSPTALGLQ